MTHAQIQLVQQSFEQLVPCGDDALEGFFAEIFYQRLQITQPALQVQFRSDATLQAQRLLNLLRLVISHLELPAPFLFRPNLELDTKNTGVASALIWTLEMTLGEDFKAELKEAWLGAYPFLAQFIVANWFI
jgi:hypothetical protein